MMKRTTKEPRLEPGSPLAPIVEQLRTMQRGLLHAAPAPGVGPEGVDFVAGKVDGLESAITLLQRAAAPGEMVNGQRLVQVHPRPVAGGDELAARVAQLEADVRELRLRADAAPARADRPTPASPAPATKKNATRAGSALLELQASSSLTLGQTRVLTAIAQSPGSVTKAELTILTGYRRSTRDKLVQQLRALGHVHATELAVTPSGVRALGRDFARLPTGDALRAHWLGRLPEGERRVLEIVCDAWPNAIPRDRLGELAGYRRSTRDKVVQRLAARKLVEAAQGALVRASDRLFTRRAP